MTKLWNFQAMACVVEGVDEYLEREGLRSSMTPEDFEVLCKRLAEVERLISDKIEEATN